MFDPGFSWEHALPEQFPYQVYAHVSTTCHTTAEPDRSDKWDAGSHAYTLDSFELSAFAPGEPIGVEFEPRAGQEVFAVMLSYGDGDTFGHTDGYHVLLDVFADRAQADALVTTLRNPPGSRKGKKTHHGGGLDEYSVTYNGRQYVRHWVGYFSTLNSLDVQPLTLQ